MAIRSLLLKQGLVAFLLAICSAFALECPSSQSLTMCCEVVEPWSSNPTYFEACGYTPSSFDEVDGIRCEEKIIDPGSPCPEGTIPTVATCCAGTWPGPEGLCSLGTNCSIPPAS